MLSLTLALPLLLPIFQDDKPTGPTEKQVEASIASLESAFEKKEDEQIATALQAVTPVSHEDVIKVVTKRCLGHRHRDIQRAGVEMLGQLKHADAMEALHKFAKSKRKQLKDDTELYVVLLQAIAKHEHVSSIPVLTKDLFGVPDRMVIRARVLGLGRIRSEESVESLFGLMKKAGRNKIQPYMNDFQLALAVLTHTDQGTSQDLWLKWWNDNRKKYELPDGVPKLPAEMQNRWNRYWGERREYERQKRRGRRGDDPEDDK